MFTTAGKIILGSLIVLCTPLLRSAERRVSSAGEIAAAMTTARSGDTLTMTNGIWTNASIMFAGFGSGSAPIVLRAESYGGVVLTGTSTLKISGKHLVVDGLLFRNGFSTAGTAVIEFRGSNGESDSCRLTNTVIRDYNPADSAVDYKWISMYGTYNRIDHCYLRGKEHQGTTLVVWVNAAKPNYHRIDHNYFAPRPVFPVNGAETIRVGTSDVSMSNSFTIVENNYFEECNGDIEVISSKSCGNVYRYNTFVNCQGTLTLRHGNRCIVEGNFIFGNHTKNSGGIRIIGEDHAVFNNYISGTEGTDARSALSMMDGIVNSPLNGYFQVKRAVVAFNTFADNKSSINLGVKGTGATIPPDSCIIANNVVSTAYGPLIIFSDSPTNLQWQGNIMYGASLGITQPAGISLTNPQIAMAADGLRRPGTSSPVINASVGSFPFLLSDMDGQSRDTSPDVGADEVSDLPIVRRPLTPADVGPPPSMLTDVTRGRIEGNSAMYGFSLEQNYPNPFNPVTRISFTVPVTGAAVVRVFNSLGQHVAVLFNSIADAGRLYQLSFDGTSLASGLYLVRLEANGKSLARKMILTK